MLKMIIDSNGFFKDKINQGISFKEPLLIFLVLAFTFFGTTTVLDYVHYKWDFLNVYSSFYAFLSLLFLPFLVFLFWTIDSFILYLSQYLFSGNGSFKRMLQFTAYCNVVLIPALILRTAYYTLVFYQSSAVKPEYVYVIANAILVLVIILRANMLRYGLKYACNLNIKSATIFAIIYSLFLIQLLTGYIKIHMTTALPVIAIVLVIIILATLSPTRYPRLTSAKQLKIDAEGAGEWTDINHTFFDNSMSGINEEFPNDFLISNIDLKELSIKDGSSLRLSKKENGITEDHIEVSTIVFNENKGAKDYFNDVVLLKEGIRISGLGDEAATYSTVEVGLQNFLIRISNTFVDVMVHTGSKGRHIADEIIKTAKEIKP